MSEPKEWGLPAATLETLRRILRAEPAIERAILFGSRAKGTYKPGSDIDLALEGRDVTLDVISRLARAFDESSIPYQVDLCWLQAVEHAALREHIARVGQVLYERGPASLAEEGEKNPCAA